MKVKRIVSIALSVIIMMTLMCSSVFASEPTLPMPRATTDYFYTPEMFAGEEWSGYAADEVHDLACSKSDLTGADINVYIYYTGVGMPNTFSKDESRKGEIEVKEEDSGWGNDNESLFTRTGSFRNDDGFYWMATWSTRSNVNTDVIEDNKTLELYILVTIQTKLLDTNNEIPENLICYKFVTTY